MSPPAAEREPADDALAILDAYDFDLPEDRIAQTPAPDRESARLLLVDRQNGAIVEPDVDYRVRDLPDWLCPGDLLVVNATRVLSARLVGRKASGGSAEALLLRPEPEPGGSFRALVKCTGRLREGLGLRFGEDGAIEATVVAMHDRGEVTLRFADHVDPYSAGVAPLPPYIRRGGAARARPDGEAKPVGAAEDREQSALDLDRYQTVYAREPGAIAAPTAGLHLTQSLFDRLRERGVGIAEVILHVGAGTFRPLDAAALESGRLHRERFELPAETVAAIERTRARGARVFAVGTTTTRVLESCADRQGRLAPAVGETDLFLRPGDRPFRVVDGLLTNFHLPRSSLLLLVAAFMGREPLLAAYQHAIRRGFRFYSYGDAMLIMPSAGASNAR